MCRAGAHKYHHVVHPCTVAHPEQKQSRSTWGRHGLFTNRASMLCSPASWCPGKCFIRREVLISATDEWTGSSTFAHHPGRLDSPGSPRVDHRHGLPSRSHHSLGRILEQGRRANAAKKKTPSRLIDGQSSLRCTITSKMSPLKWYHSPPHACLESIRLCETRCELL
jgi:hypothetical protein